MTGPSSSFRLATKLLIDSSSRPVSSLAKSPSNGSIFQARPLLRSFTLASTLARSSTLFNSERRHSRSSGVQFNRGFASSSIVSGWNPLTWGGSSSSSSSSSTTTTVSSTHPVSFNSEFVPEHTTAAPTPGAADIISSSSSSSAVDSTSEKIASTVESAKSTASSIANKVNDAVADISSTSSDNIAFATATTTSTDTDAQTFYLPGDDHIFSGTLDLTGLASSWGPHPIQRLQSMFLHLHESFPIFAPGSGLQWFILIPTVTIGLRMILFWFQVRANANAARLAIIQPEMLAGMERVKAAKARGDMTGVQTAQMETAALMAKHKVNPLKNLVFPLAQGIVFMVVFLALRGLANAGLPSMANEGIGWVQDLTQPDSSWALPIASSALTLATLELGVDNSTTVQTTTTKNMKAFFRFMLIVSIPFIAYFPAAILLYWVTNNTFSLLQSQLLKLAPVRAFFNIPTPPPKKLPGEKGYIKEPTFAEAFKNMQTAQVEKAQEAADKAKEKVRIASQFKNDSNTRAEVYVPAAPSKPIGKVEQVARSLTHDGDLKGAKGQIRAEPINLLDEKARRVQAARERRQKRK